MLDKPSAANKNWVRAAAVALVVAAASRGDSFLFCLIGSGGRGVGEGEGICFHKKGPPLHPGATNCLDPCRPYAHLAHIHEA